MTRKALMIIAALPADQAGAPETVLLAAAGWVEVEGFGRLLVDKAAFDLVAAHFKRRGVDLVWDYEHQTLTNAKAPAAGWVKALEWDAARGIMAKVEWTEHATALIAKREYRYFSPVYFVRNSDKRLAGFHSVALTNSPKTNNLTPLAAKLDAWANEEESMDFLKQLIAKLGLAAEASEEAVLAAVEEIKTKAKALPVVAKDILGALDLTEGDTSTVVASIEALKQQPKGMVSQEDFDNLQKKIASRDAAEAVQEATVAGKITPDQTDWAKEYAGRDLAGFKLFVAKAPVVVPVGKLPGKKDDITDQAADVDAATMAIAKDFGHTAEDIKKYCGQA